MGQLEKARKKIFDVLNTGKHIYIFCCLGNEVGCRKDGHRPISGLLVCFALESAHFCHRGMTESMLHQVQNGFL